mmetsp:Transcript_20438/g.45582  ORF Transcript_20438/g.45582 Transcript_20438/m.45582 type:complete len:250 (+) Transcript_20438:621-1370(+)
MGTAESTAAAASIARCRSFSISDVANPPSNSRAAGTPSITPGHGLYVSEDQHRADEVLNMDASVCLSTPSRWPSNMPSATPAIDTASTKLLHSLAACPLPTGPQCTMDFPISASSGRLLSTPASSPPTMNVRLAFSAPTTPPETGASTNVPTVAAALPTSRATAGSMVEQSTSASPCMASGATSNPLAPICTFCTCSELGSMLTTCIAPESSQPEPLEDSCATRSAGDCATASTSDEASSSFTACGIAS